MKFRLREYEQYLVWFIHELTERNQTWAEVRQNFIARKSQTMRVHLPRTKVRR